MDKVRLALVGFGKWGKNYLAAARASGVAEVTQVVLREGSPRRAEAEQLGLPVVWDIQDLDVDAAVIATGPAGAALIAPVLIELSAIPVLIEKPAALTTIDAQSLVDSELESGRIVLIGHQHLFAAAYEELRALAFGRAERASARFTGPVIRDAYPALFDYGAHAAACLVGIAGPPALPVMRRGGETDINFMGATTVCVGLARNSSERLAIVQAWVDGVLLVYDGYAPAEPSLTREVRAFAEAVRAGGTDDWRFGARWAADVANVLGAGGALDTRPLRQ